MSDKLEEWGNSLTPQDFKKLDKILDTLEDPDIEANRIIARCPKCGNNDVYARYREQGRKLWGKEAIACRQFTSNFTEATSSDMNRGVLDVDCIFLHCQTCQYNWSEKTIDS